MISEQRKEMEWLRDVLRKGGKVPEYYESQWQVIGRAIDTIETLSAKVRANNLYGGWIPCSERLPEEEKKVIISTKTEAVRVGVYTKRYGVGMREGFICEDGFMWMNTANAWMPLPEPYKGE